MRWFKIQTGPESLKHSQGHGDGHVEPALVHDIRQAQYSFVVLSGSAYCSSDEQDFCFWL
jgi:hypothetical protein